MMQRRNLWIGVIAAAALAQGWADAAAQQAQAAQSPTTPAQAAPLNAGPAASLNAGIDALTMYSGVWKIHTEQFDTAHSKASIADNTLRNACWKNGPYFACNQYVDGVSKVLLIFTFVPSENRYATYQVPQDGGQPGSGKLFIFGNVWIFPWESTESDKQIHFRVVNTFSAPDRIEYRQEFSADDEHWTVMAKGLETKIGNE
jgi:hypothetical protein